MKATVTQREDMAPGTTGTCWREDPSMASQCSVTYEVMVQVQTAR